MGLLKDKFVIITGAASPRGLGKAMAQMFAEHGATVAILDLDDDAAEAAAADLGEGHVGLACNVTDKAACDGGGRRPCWTAGAASTCWSTMPASPSR